MSEERRKSPRILIKFLVECRGKTVWQNVQSFNLCKGGMFIATEKLEAPGTAIEIIFDLKDRKIQAQSIVRWNRNKMANSEEEGALPVGMGIEFLRIFPADAEDFLKELIKKEGNNG